MHSVYLLTRLTAVVVGTYLIVPVGGTGTLAEGGQVQGLGVETMQQGNPVPTSVVGAYVQLIEGAVGGCVG